MAPADWKAREALLLAPYAMHAADSVGRVHSEPWHPFRSPYQRDHDRIVHSAAFRRLAHKTQVFTGYHGDYHRSRLTHTLEVPGIARTLARTLALNEDLVEALALAHDIGHPPLGHAGEDTLDELLEHDGGFNHNAQALRIMELLENRYPDFPGLNLSREILEAQAARVKGRPAAGIHLDAAPLLETQAVDAADSIAYDTHDADDAIELGLVTLDELLDLPLVATAGGRARDRYGAIAGNDLRRAVIHELVDLQVADLVAESRAAIDRLGIDSVARVRAGAGPGRPRTVTHSSTVAAGKIELERFLFQRVYRSELVMTVRAAVQEKLTRLFRWYCDHPDAMAPSFRERVAQCGVPRSAADYIAGMTDRYLEWDHDRRVC
jgi:dGTPase